MDLEISCQQTRDLLSTDTPPLLLDCREQDEYDLVSVAGARLMPMSEIISRASELAGREAEHIIVYCHHGGRSAQIAMWLRRRGFEHAQSMAGGIDKWAVDIDPGLPRY